MHWLGATLGASASNVPLPASGTALAISSRPSMAILWSLSEFRCGDAEGSGLQRGEHEEGGRPRSEDRGLAIGCIRKQRRERGYGWVAKGKERKSRDRGKRNKVEDEARVDGTQRLFRRPDWASLCRQPSRRFPRFALDVCSPLTPIRHAFAPPYHSIDPTFFNVVFALATLFYTTRTASTIPQPPPTSQPVQTVFQPYIAYL